MRGRAASINLTIGAAVATLVVVGGILAGPAVVDCSKASGGFGACLRDRLDVRTPDVPVAPVPPTEDGWIEAAVNEDEPPTVPAVDLAAPTADIAVANLLQASSQPIAVAIVPPAELAIATSTPAGEMPTVALVAPEGQLVAEGPAVAVSAPELSVEPAPVEPAPDLTVAIEPPPAEPVPIQLSAEPAPEPTPVEPSSEPSSEPRSSSEPASSEPEPEPSEPALVVEYNPSYPNVIVLPTPLTGDDSAFRSLQLD